MDLNRRALLGGAAVAGLASTPAFATTHGSGGGRAHTSALRSLAPYVEQHRADWGLAGMTVCAVDRDGYAGFITSGFADVDKRTPINADHLFQIGSITKMMTALTAWSLVQEGKLSPTVKLSELMPEITVANGGDITLQHLLNHTSGLPDSAPLFPEGGLWSGYAPGSRWSYCNTGYQIIGQIIARADNRPFPDALQARVLTPLGMTHARPSMRVADRMRYAQGYEPAFSDRAGLRPGPMTQAPWVDSDSAAGCVAATAGDMAVLLRFLLELSQGRGGAVLSDAVAARFMADAADAPGWAPNAKYGNGIARVSIDERQYLHHTGGMVSFCSALHVDAEAGVAAFASTNTGFPLNYRPRDVTLQACRVLRAARTGDAALPPRPARASVEHAERYVGVFTAASGVRFEVRAQGDQLKLRRNGADSDMQLLAPIFAACSDPQFAVTGLVFEAGSDALARVWAGDVEYLPHPEQGFKPPAPAALQALAGRYDNDDRWAGPLYIYARDGKLWLNNIDVLTPLPDGSYRIGDDDWSPERARFGGAVAGRPTRLLLSGGVYVRRFS